jgi:hypothetical protein
VKGSLSAGCPTHRKLGRVYNALFLSLPVLPVPTAPDHSWAMAREQVPHHYYLVSVKRVGDGNPWMWEIQRTPALGARLYGESFHSAQAAKLDGEKAPRELLKSISNESPDV